MLTNKQKKQNVLENSYVGERCATAFTRSIGAEDLIAWPVDERAPRIHWMADLKREKEMRLRIQHIVALYEWSHLFESKPLIKCGCLLSHPPGSRETPVG